MRYYTRGSTDSEGLLVDSFLQLTQVVWHEGVRVGEDGGRVFGVLFLFLLDSLDDVGGGVEVRRGQLCWEGGRRVAILF